MKTIVTLLFVIASLNLFGQSFYKSYAKPEFKNLMEKGLFYLKTGDSISDESYIKSITDSWDVTKVTVLDSLDNSLKLTGNEIFIVEAKFTDSGGEVIGLLPLKLLVKNQASKYSMIGFVALNGFDQKEDKTSKLIFLDQTISGLNDVVKTIKDNEIKKIGAGLYKSINKSIIPSSKSLSGKTLLIVGDTKDYVNESTLNKAGIKFEKLSSEEYAQRQSDDLSDYCLMYFAYNAFTEVSIYNLENNDLIYTMHYINGKRKLTGGDISSMKKHW